MRRQIWIIAGALILAVVSASSLNAQTVVADSQVAVIAAKRSILAIKYPEGDDTKVSMIGTVVSPMVSGEAGVERKLGRTRIKLKLENLPHPQSLGSFHTTYILWAVAPEGQTTNLAELPIRNKLNVEVTTAFQTFGLIVTAEPHSAVTLPSPVIVAENMLRRGTEGGIESSRLEYSGDAGALYVVTPSAAPAPDADYRTPLLVLGARRAVEIARRAGGQEYAEAELRDAEITLAALEQFWPGRREDEARFNAMARDVMRKAEHARTLAVQRAEQARLESERRSAMDTIAEARGEADRAQLEAERSRQAAAAYRDAIARAENEAALARQRADQAQTEAERARAREEIARIEAERARLEAEQAQTERARLEQRLFISLSEILETRREARGLIVSLSDVLFDFNRSTLTPGAREKLSKLAGILMAYPGDYRMEIEGHTDSVGSDQYNMRLSQERADSVRFYLIQSGIAAAKIIRSQGFGKTMPVAGNETAAGRQQNRRVEIVISDLQNR